MRGICELCGNWEDLEKHHAFTGARRKISERYKAYIHVCPWCHRIDADAIHRSCRTRDLVQRMAQKKVMREQGWTVEQWQAAGFEKNYLDAEELEELTAPPLDNLGGFRVLDTVPALPY